MEQQQQVEKGLLDKICDLIDARVQGNHNNTNDHNNNIVSHDDDLEEAVHQLLVRGPNNHNKNLPSHGVPPSNQTILEKRTTRSCCGQLLPVAAEEEESCGGGIEEDTENYDDEEEEGEPAAAAAAATTKVGKKRKRRGRPQKPENQWKYQLKQTMAQYEHIPLGQQGAKMLVSFGDGKSPLPETVSQALLGARKMIQVAVQDARHVRRQTQQVYNKARAAMRIEKPSLPEQRESWSHEIMYRAVAGTRDELAYSLPAGFGMEELQKLYPEEMNAYMKWNDLHEQANDSKNQAGKTIGNEDDGNGRDDGSDQDGEEKGTLLIQDADVGHLKERAGQFDVRTERMQHEWYLRFSEVRRGSFLPKRSQRTTEDIDWDDARKSGKVGTPKQSRGTWAQLSSKAVRFLHWAGFDPQSALPPPKMEITEALAFLCYDFFGRIVERAIYHRTVEKLQAAGKSEHPGLVLELEPGEQLEPADIERAMNDPLVKPVPIYSTSGETQPQLYFGPGFEERLELELEEFLSKKDLPEDEIEARKAEEDLFASIQAPPSKSDVEKVLGGPEEDEDDSDPELEEDQEEEQG